MLEVFRKITDYDTISFVPNINSENGDEVKVEISNYKDSGEKIGGSPMGDLYEIILFRMDEEYNLTDLDKFEGILIEPREYVSRMIKENWYGLVAKKTTTSDKLTSDVFAKWSDF